MPTGIAKSGKRQCPPRVERIAITCEVCGKVRLYLPSEVRQRKAIRFCSRACMGIANTMPERHVEFTCSQCGKIGTKRADHLTENNYCSRKCAGIARRNPDSKWHDPEHIKQYNHAYNEQHKERVKPLKREWARKNPQVKAAIQRARRAGEKSGRFTAAEWEEMKRQYNYRCLCCKRKEPEVALEADHIQALVDGGEHTASNIQPLCRSCNATKGKKNIDYRAC